MVVEAETLEDALDIESSTDSDRYLRHMMSRQMRVPQFADPTELDRLIQWIKKCDDAIG